MRRPIPRLVHDTNVWLDWLLFDDSLDAAAQAACLAARADFLVTKDRALLDLGRRGRSLPFRIVTPHGLEFRLNKLA